MVNHKEFARIALETIERCEPLSESMKEGCVRSMEFHEKKTYREPFLYFDGFAAGFASAMWMISSGHLNIKIVENDNG